MTVESEVSKGSLEPFERPETVMNGTKNKDGHHPILSVSPLHLTYSNNHSTNLLTSQSFSYFIVYNIAPTMLPKEWHLWASHAFGDPMSGSIRWYIVHWDQRRTITVTFDCGPEMQFESRETAIGR